MPLVFLLTRLHPIGAPPLAFRLIPSSPHRLSPLASSPHRLSPVGAPRRSLHPTLYTLHKIQNSIVHDTIIHTDSIVQVIKHPPERYVPKFHKWCTVALWAIIALVIGYWAMRITA